MEISQALIWVSLLELMRRIGERKASLVIAALWPLSLACPDSEVVSQITMSPSLDPEASRNDVGFQAIEQTGLTCPLSTTLRVPEIFQIRMDPSPYPTEYS